MIFLAAGGGEDIPLWALVFGGAGATALITQVGAILLRRMGRRGEEATIARTVVETDHLRAQAERARIEAGNSALEQAGAVAAMIRAELDRMQGQLSSYERALGAHTEWDQRAAEVLRTIDPAFPSPPPLRITNTTPSP